MSRSPILPDYPKCAARAAAAAALLILSLACRDDAALPFESSEEPGDPELAAAPVGSSGSLTLDTRSKQAGIVFGSTGGVLNVYLDRVHTGWLNGGSLSPSNILSSLSGARSKGGRVVIKLCKGRDEYVKNSDGTFSLAKWKSLVSRYKTVNLGPYISDGTIIGHYLIDEPHRAARWGGKAIPYKTLEEMARFSKEIWPQMHTMIRVAPSWLAGAPFQWRYVDAGWTQYRATLGDAAKWVGSEAAIAEREGLGLVVGLNLLNGGNGSSNIRGATRGKWAMSASEIRKYGSAMLASKHACGFFNWTWDSEYYGRSDIRSAMADVSSKARNHAKTSCRQ